MKHITLSNTFEFGIEPFPAFRANLVFGRNKRDREFLPVQNIIPVIYYKVTGSGDGQVVILYEGTDKAAAEKAKTEWEAKVDMSYIEPAPNTSPFATRPRKRYTASISTETPTLPEGKFRLIKTQSKETLMIVPGEDGTTDALVFVGCDEGFRGGVSLLKNATTGEIVKTCQAGNATGGRIDVIARLEVGQSVGFYTYGRRTDEVYVYTWNGEVVEKKHYSKSEWDLQTELTQETTIAEVAVPDPLPEIKVEISVDLLKRLIVAAQGKDDEAASKAQELLSS